MAEDGAVTGLPINLSDAETAIDSLVVTVRSSNPDLIDLDGLVPTPIEGDDIGLGPVVDDNGLAHFFAAGELTWVGPDDAGIIETAPSAPDYLTDTLTDLGDGRVAYLTGPDTDQRTQHVLEQVGLGDRGDHFPSQMSGGEQQRVAIARGLVKGSPLLLCDEPTGALDIETGVRVLSALDDAVRSDRRTVVVVTHNAVIARMADRVIRFADGRVQSIRENAGDLRERCIAALGRRGNPFAGLGPKQRIHEVPHRPLRVGIGYLRATCAAGRRHNARGCAAGNRSTGVEPGTDDGCNRGRQQRGCPDGRHGPGQEPMRGIAEIDLIRMHREPLRSKASREISAHRRSRQLSESQPEDRGHGQGRRAGALVGPRRHRRQTEPGAQ